MRQTPFASSRTPALWRALAGGLALAATLAAPFAHAQGAGSYPSKTIRLVVPFAPGGSTDILGRLLAQKMGESMHTTVVVDNKPGANGTIGCDLVAKAPADGYTVVLGDVGCMAMAKGLYTKLPYDPLRDFAPISLVARSPLVLTVGAQSPFHSLKDKIGHVPYKGSAPSVVSLAAGETDFGFLTAVTIAAQLKAGKVRALAVAHNERLQSMPDVPTMSEAGLKDFTADAWFLAAVPAGTPKPIVDRLYAEIAKALPAPEVKEKLDAMGVLPSGLKPDASAQFLRVEVDKWRDVIKNAGITLD